MAGSKTSQPITHPDGSVEWACMKCGEPLLMFKGDPIAVSVGENGEVDGVVCERCSDLNGQEAQHGR
jgi:DNA-directed RNA polymerase subunit RPC12/RpoP